MAKTTCSKCGLTPKDGSHYSYCKRCFAAYVKARHVPKPIVKTPPAVLRERERARSRRYYAEHREARLVQQRQYVARERERVAASNRRRWAERADEERQIIARKTSQLARCREKGVPFVEYVDPLVVLEREDGVCGVCGEDVDPFRFEMDHVVPMRRGGEHSYANTQVTHPTCNRQKGTKVLHVA